MVDLLFLRKWVRTEYPRDAAREKIGGTVKVRFIADAKGVITSARALESPDPRLEAAALAAVKQWEIDLTKKIDPDVSCCADVDIEFKPGEKLSDEALQSREHPHRVPTSQAIPLDTPEGDYPDLMRGRKLSGKVLFKAIVTETGDLTGSTILAASHSDFVLPALASLQKWKFKPKTQGDLALSDEVEGAVSFSAEEASPADVLVANGITMPDGSAPELPAVIVVACDAVWPIEAILAGTDGSATVDFTITPKGTVRDVAVVSATQHDLGQSLLAAMETWVFAPQSDAMDAFAPRVRNTALSETRMRRTLAFTAPNEAGGAHEREAVRLITALREGTIQGAKGLDRKPTPIYRAMPHYPGIFVGREAPSGQAVVDVVIDREGRVRLPRIVSASQPEFGWAAATAAAQWVFQAPTRAGAPTEVKVRIPFDFKPVTD